jgi:hypothetical protein
LLRLEAACQYRECCKGKSDPVPDH